MSRTVARLLAESLEAHDVDQVYCVPGESYVGLTSFLLERNSIRVIVCRHEAGAGYMAVAEGRLRAVKNGRRTVILREDAMAFLAALPAFKPRGSIIGVVRRAMAAHGGDRRAGCRGSTRNTSATTTTATST